MGTIVILEKTGIGIGIIQREEEDPAALMGRLPPGTIGPMKPSEKVQRLRRIITTATGQALVELTAWSEVTLT